MVVPLASRLVINNGYAQRHLGDQGLRTYLSEMTALGGALNHLPGDFVTDMSAGREQAVQATVSEAIRRLRTVMSKLPDPRNYNDILDKIQAATTVDRIGHEVDQKLRRQESQH